MDKLLTTHYQQLDSTTKTYDHRNEATTKQISFVVAR